MKKNQTIVILQVSVIIPVFNATKFIKDAVQSALIQPETAEIILIDDGSTDGSYELCQELTQNDKIRLLTHPNHAHKRAGASRNLGIKHAQYEFIAFLDADDYFTKNRFKKAKEVFDKYPNADGTYGLLGLEYHSQKGKQIYNRHQKSATTGFSLKKDVRPEDLFEQFLLEKSSFSIPTVILKKSSITPDLLFDEHLFQGQDTDFKLKWILTKRLYPENIETPVTIYRIHDNNTTHNINEACYFLRQTYLPWINRIKSQQWSKKTNRMIVRKWLAGYGCHAPKVVRFFLKFINLFVLLIKKPWLIKYIF